MELKLGEGGGLDENTTRTLRTLCGHPSQGTVAVSAQTARVEGYGVAEWGVLAPTSHPRPQFPWVLLGLTNQLEWLLLRGIISVHCSPTIHQALAG